MNNLTINQTIGNNLNLGGTFYIEKVCNNYITNMNTMFIQIAFLNIIYFLIIRRLFSRKSLKFSNFEVVFNDIFEVVIIIANTLVCGYYIIYAYNNLVFNNLKVITSSVTFIMIATILFFVFFNFARIKIFFKKAKENIKDDD